MTRSGERDLSRIGGIDYLLMTAGACLAAFSGGMAIQDTSVLLFSIVAISLGALTSYCVRGIYIGTPYIKYDGYLYSLAIVFAFAFGGPLENLMPNGGYATDVLAAGWLTWMLILGSFFTWQDTTLVFQAIPSIALLGLVGVYDTFRDIRFAFFGYLLCLATLFARAHRRAMLRQAADSGYFTRGLAPGTPSPSVETTPGLAKRMEDGPWKWTAGPQWALISAFAVVLISLFGTPVIQESVQSVTGFVKVPIPNSVKPKTAQAPTMASTSGRTVEVGQGPNHLTKEPVLEFHADGARYLRCAWYDLYSNGTWACSINSSAADGRGDNTTLIDLESLNAPLSLPFSLRLRQLIQYIPIPGSLLRGWDHNAKPGAPMANGSWLAAPSSVNGIVKGEAVVPEPGNPIEAVHDLPDAYREMVNTDSIPDDVSALAREAAKSGSNDFERAEAIRRKIASTIVYNLEAARAPDSVDPVSNALFTTHEAYCDLYATAMTLMARAVGIPARYCIGYLPDESERDSNGDYIVLESDLHAWSELYFKDYGWVVFDATDGADSVPGGERGSANDDGPLWRRPWVKTVLDGTILALFLLAAIYLVRIQIARVRAKTVQSELTSAYVSLVKVLERATRTRKTMSQTPDEYFKSVEGQLGVSTYSAKQLNARFVRALYGQSDIASPDVAKLRAEVRNLGRMLRKANPPR